MHQLSRRTARGGKFGIRNDDKFWPEHIEPFRRERFASHRQSSDDNVRLQIGMAREKRALSRFAEIGCKLADLHANYESAAEYKLKRIENRDESLNWRVEKMRLTKDKNAIIYNDFLTLDGIPPETFAYRLGNRSALEWVIDQYQVSTDKRSGITNDPNREDEPDYIVKLIGKVIAVSLETQKLIAQLPPLEVERS